MRLVEYVAAFFAGILACATTSARERTARCEPPGTDAGVEGRCEGEAAAAVREAHAAAVNRAADAGGSIAEEAYRPAAWCARAGRRAASATRAM
jgi:hypothetical protein